jgi:hypothetical protein
MRHCPNLGGEICDHGKQIEEIHPPNGDKSLIAFYLLLHIYYWKWWTFNLNVLKYVLSEVHQGNIWEVKLVSAMPAGN